MRNPAPLITLLLASMLAGIAYAPTVTSPDVAFRAASGGGYVYLQNPAQFLSVTMNGTGGIVDFRGFRWTPTNAYWKRFGVECDSPGNEWNITAVTRYSITVDTTPGSVGRLWVPDQTGGLKSVVGGTGVWNPVNMILTVTSTNNIFTVTWYAPGTNPSRVSGQITSAARLVVDIIPVFCIILVFVYPDRWKLLVSVGVTVAVLMVISSFVLGMGL